MHSWRRRHFSCGKQSSLVKGRLVAKTLAHTFWHDEGALQLLGMLAYLILKEMRSFLSVHAYIYTSPRLSS